MTPQHVIHRNSAIVTVTLKKTTGRKKTGYGRPREGEAPAEPPVCHSSAAPKVKERLRGDLGPEGACCRPVPGFAGLVPGGQPAGVSRGLPQMAGLAASCRALHRLQTARGARSAGLFRR